MEKNASNKFGEKMGLTKMPPIYGGRQQSKVKFLLCHLLEIAKNQSIEYKRKIEHLLVKLMNDTINIGELILILEEQNSYPIRQFLSKFVTNNIVNIRKEIKTYDTIDVQLNAKLLECVKQEKEESDNLNDLIQCDAKTDSILLKNNENQKFQSNTSNPHIIRNNRKRQSE
ncbi:hypothetical protein A3Q56_04646 [Intoshia linei]|uniref:TAFH domain-containing protein n=1 Tax=Intoshia linei TaxID=1819745 RepID=A0A177B1I6_9BILA|nr:hypothetical protein A3Q56_04646 [Intoshia linei]